MTTAPASDPSTATSYVLRNLNFYLEGRAIAIDMFGVLGLPTQVRDPHVTLFFRSAGFGQTEVAAVRTKAAELLGDRAENIQFSLEPYGPRSDLIRGELSMVCELLRSAFPGWNGGGRVRPIHIELRK